MLVAGVDAAKGGWVAVTLADGEFESAQLIAGVDATFDELADATVIGIDIPIGFGPGRLADERARSFLKGGASTVFSTPSRAILETPFRAGLHVSKQSHDLGPRVIHVTDLQQTDRRFREVHPEVSFRAMNDGRALEYKKKSAGGAYERQSLLKGHGIDIDIAKLGTAATAALDDVLDAGAAAWSAHRIATGSARSLPDPPARTEGREIAIWY